MRNKQVQRPANAGATGGATGRATPGQRPANGGATLSPYTPSVAPALGGGVHAYDLEALATRVRRLTVHHRDPERFHVEKSEIVHDLH